MFVPVRSQSLPRPQVLLALDRGDLDWVRRHAAGLPSIGLAEGLQLCLIVRDRQAEQYEEATVRWLGRFVLEAPHASVEDVRLAAEALEELPADPESSMQLLAEICRRHSLAGW